MSATSRNHLVPVESDTHGGEWTQMVSCPIRDCDASQGEDYEHFSVHLANEHDPEDLGLPPIGGKP